MRKHAFKIMGALLILALAVSMAGTVSAYVIPSSEIHTINIVDGSVVLTKDVPVWGSGESNGNFVNAKTAYGALRTGYVDLNKQYTGTIDFNTGIYTITTINGSTASGNYV